MMGSIILNCRIQSGWILDSSWTLILSKFSGLCMVSESSWILDLDSWILAIPPYFLRCSASILESSLSPTLTGVSGSGHRFRLATPSWPMSSAPSINQSKKPGGDASDQERHRHPHHTATQGEAIWINRV